MSFAGINYLAVLLAGVASFVFGGVWYGALSRVWLDAVGRTMEELKASSPVVPYVVTFICQLVMAAMLAGVIGHLGKGYVTMKSGLISAVFIWLGFVVTTLVVNHTFQGARRMLTVIDAGHWLGVLLVQGAIIGWMGVN